MPVAKKPVPTHLRKWMQEVQNVKNKFPSLSHAEALAKASQLRKKKVKK